MLVGGLIAVAVGNEVVIAHPHGHGSVETALLPGCGPLLFLAAQSWYLRAVPKTRSRLRLLGSILLICGSVASVFLPAYIALILTNLTLTGLAAVDVTSKQRVEPGRSTG